MGWPKYIFVSMLMTSFSSVSEEIRSIEIFHNNAKEILIDIKYSKAIAVNVYDMDSVGRSEKELTEIVRKKALPNIRKYGVQEAYKKAFSEILNSGEWSSIYNDIIQATASVEYAMRYKISKVPAIVINEQSVIYGVSSLNEAVDIYSKNGVRQ